MNPEPFAKSRNLGIIIGRPSAPDRATTTCRYVLRFRRNGFPGWCGLPVHAMHSIWCEDHAAEMAGGPIVGSRVCA